ncbi:unnamed protein product, partial [Mesorhabditis belari]|uniref:Uncharacterized protein n=1 Tax=Mesorhabditis belari TaxID=2138241 RepID=A0AAF3E9D3_9BILA
MPLPRSLGSDGEVVRHKTTSNYLGWTERKPRGFHDKFDHTSLPGGEATRSYETYVKGIFTPGRVKDEEQRKRDHGVSAQSMMRMERAYGRYALDSYEDEDLLMKTPLERMYIELGLQSPEVHESLDFPRYHPKTSYEWVREKFSARNRPRPWDPVLPSEMLQMPTNIRHYSLFREGNEDEWRKNNKQSLIDYKDFKSSPLSPYLYREHPYIRSQDTRIVGSNFVQVTTRPKDRFLEKVDQTLAEVRAMPRFG